MKKLASILLILTCIVGLTACGDQKEGMKHDPDAIKLQSQCIYDGMTAEYTNEQFEMFDDFTSDQYDEYAAIIYENSLAQGSGIRAEGQVYIDGIYSWVDAKDEIGTATCGDIEIDAKEDELIVSVNIDGTVHDAVMEIMYDKNLHVTSITTNVIYSVGELMEKAGVNTLIGMGTVFIVLILISLIIGCFGFIPKIQASFSKKKEVKEAEKDSVDNAIAGIIEREEKDDLELIAVIAAAIAASEGASSTDGFVVRSIRRIR